jgi:hypothetical protein
MAIQERNTIKTYFETGDKPTQQEFEHLLDSAYMKADDPLLYGKVLDLTLAPDSIASFVIQPGYMIMYIVITANAPGTVNIGLSPNGVEISDGEPYEVGTNTLIPNFFSSGNSLYFSSNTTQITVQAVLLKIGIV